MNLEELDGATRVLEPRGRAPLRVEAGRMKPHQADFDQHFVKPVSMDTLLDLLKSLG